MTLKKLAGYTTNFILAICIIFTVLIVVSSQLSHSGKNIFGIEVLTVLSGSMEPGIKTGSIIIGKTVTENKESFTVGDVITYKSLEDPNVLITHRIVEVEQRGSQIHYVTKGDNNDVIDPAAIPAENVVALYSNITIPLLGYIFTFASSKIGIILLLIVPGVIILITQAISVWRTIVNMDEEQEEKPTLTIET